MAFLSLSLSSPPLPVCGSLSLSSSSSFLASLSLSLSSSYQRLKAGAPSSILSVQTATRLGLSFAQCFPSTKHVAGSVTIRSSLSSTIGREESAGFIFLTSREGNGSNTERWCKKLPEPMPLSASVRSQALSQLSCASPSSIKDSREGQVPSSESLAPFFTPG